MAERIWDRFLTDRDKKVFAASGFGARGGVGTRPALIVVDVSWAFAGDTPGEDILDSIRRWPNSCGPQSWDAIARIKELCDGFRARRLPVIYTTGVSRDDGWDMGSWSWKNSRIDEGLPGRHRVDGNEIVAAIAPQPQDLLVLKQKPSGFFGTNLQSYLTLLGADSVVVTGTTTSGCVRATVLDAFSLNYRIAVAEDACFDRAEASHAINLCDMHAKYADVLSTAEVLSFVATLPDDLFPGLPEGERTAEAPGLAAVG